MVTVIHGGKLGQVHEFEATRYFSTAVFTSSLLRTKTLSQLGYNEKEEKPHSSSQPVYPRQEKTSHAFLSVYHQASF